MSILSLRIKEFKENIMDNKNNAGIDNAGIYNAGSGNAGNRNAGWQNAGVGNAGDRNAGNRNAGDNNSGDNNSGDDNAGNENAGVGNAGNGNAGCWNTGDRNAGNWNKSDGNAGHLNTTQLDEIRVFNKPCSRKDWGNADIPFWMYFVLIKWTGEYNMSDQEKQENPEYKTTGGYLKVYDYQEAAKRSWDNASDGDKLRIYKLPNFDAKVAQEIFGIDFEAYLESIKPKVSRDIDIIELNGIKYKRI
jgi:hypothetical protein